MKKWLQLLAVIIGAVVGYQWGNSPGFLMRQVQESLGTDMEGTSYWLMLVGAASGLIVVQLADTVGRRWVRSGEEYMLQMPLAHLMSGLLGLILGLLVAVLAFPALEGIGAGSKLLPVLATMLLGVGGFRFGYAKKDDLIGFFSKWSFGKEKEEDDGSRNECKILDTSVIIDGRIADICKTGFIEGTLVIPEFVLEELQHIADSSDLLKRNRGRRGLDILNKIQKELDVKVLIYEGDFEEISEVDSKLVRLAKVLRGKVITNDFNLNKVCELQGVPVLNINDLANAVKPVVLPGEEIVVQVIKDGKEHGQGVAYLDDGTMIVVEGGREYIGATMEVMVTSVLQTSAGRMIFAKPKLLEKAQ
ncbi:MAG: hypothetical protein K0R57_4214 [Paenibacillaceae bacterium]|nr:hypothetical protein [Paenibacillaceae bacterium]